MTIPETVPAPRRLWPADYYSTPTPSAVLPSWVTFGCGGLSLVALVIVFAGGAWLAGGGMVDFMDMAVGMSLGEMRGMYAGEVAAPQRKALEDDIAALRENLREKKISPADLQPFLDGLRRATSDRKLTVAEAQSLQKTVRGINAKATP
jgi:hypothetical protein